MARRERPLDPSGSPTEALAYWLRMLRDEAGMTVGQLRQPTMFSSSTLYSAFGGAQLPTWEVTFAIVRACHGDTGAWQAYWSQMRRLAADGIAGGPASTFAPAWAAPQAQRRHSETSQDRPAHASSGGPAEHGPDDTPLPEQNPAAASGAAQPEPRPQHRRLRRLLAVVGCSVLLVVATVILTTVLNRERVTASEHGHPAVALVTVQNKVAVGPSGLLEDTTPAYLSSRPVPRCRLKGCRIEGTDMRSGDVLPVTCWTRGAKMTNENTGAEGINKNPNGLYSTLWYRGTWLNGRSGYLSEVYVKPAYRGGLNLPECRA